MPEDVWNQLNEAQKQETIKGYNEQARIDKERRLVEKKRSLEREERHRKQAAIEAERTRKRVKAIYDGTAGVFGDLIRVSIHGGEMRFNGKHHGFEPTSFKLADGERKQLVL